MVSKHLIDPQLRPLIDAMPPMDLSLETLGARRAVMAQMLAQAPPPPVGLAASREVLQVQALDGSGTVRVLAYRPTQVDDETAALLHIHGGGYVAGSADMMDVANRELCAALGCAIFSVDYRLAPEVCFPGALDDCYAVLKWLYDEAENLKLDRARIGVKGESAGGGLAAALALMARDRGEVALAFQHLIYPMIDDRTCVKPDPHPLTGEFIWTNAHNHFGWSALLGAEPGEADVSAYAAAARATDLAGLPPTYISVGALDLFLEENLEYARRLTRAGVPVELQVYPGVVHGFQMFQSADVAQRSQHDSREALLRALKADFAGQTP